MWELEKYSEKRFDDMLEMTRENYGEIEISDKNFIDHQYFKNPAGDALIRLAYDHEKDKLAGQYITIPMRVNIEKQEQRCILSLNTLTRSEYRGQKVFTTMAADMFDHCLNTEIQFCYGAPNQNSHHGFIAKLGFRDIGVIPLYVRPLRPSRLVYEKLHWKWLKNVLSPVDRLFKPREKKKIGHEITEITEKNIGLFDVLWPRIRDKYPVIIVRDSAYMRWRYTELPLRQYKIFMAKRGDEPLGYIIGRVSKVGEMQCGMVTDFIVREGEEAAGRNLVNKIGRYFYDNGVELLGCLMQKWCEETRCLKKERFFKCPKALEPQPFPIIFRPFNSEIDNSAVSDFRNWFFTMGDYDAI